MALVSFKATAVIYPNKMDLFLNKNQTDNKKYEKNALWDCVNVSQCGIWFCGINT